MTKNLAKVGKNVSNILVYALLSILGVLWVLPICYLIYTAFRVTPSTGIINTLLPDNLKLGFGNFTRLFQDTMFTRWLLNTLFVASCSCALTTIFILMVSYALSRLRFRMRKPIMNVLLVLGMFPGFMSMIAVYFILKAMGLTNSLFALILVYSGSAALSYYICKGFFDTVPRAMEEAAILDGANQPMVFWKIILPMAKPIIVYTVLTSFISPWCDFIFVNTIISDRTKYTVSLGLYKMINAERNSFNDNLLVYKDIKPEISVKNMYDKYIISGNKNKKQVALLFLVEENDDIKPILNILDEREVEATFYIDGNWFEKNNELVFNIFELGHNIGNLGYSYNYNVANIDWMNNIITKVVGQKNNYCYNTVEDQTAIGVCSSNKSYTIRPNTIVKNNPLIEVKSNLNNGYVVPNSYSFTGNILSTSTPYSDISLIIDITSM